MTAPNPKPIGVAVVGCGNIAKAYLKDIPTNPDMAVAGLFDEQRERAETFATANGWKVFDTLDALLADDGVRVVVNLTSFKAHHDVTRRALLAGKHVYSEKPLALTVAEAEDLVRIADASGVRLGCSPSVWLAPAQQTAWREVATGRIGTPRVAYAEVNHGRIESWHPDPQAFYEVGPVFDVGVYPLALLTAILGPVRRVTAFGRVLLAGRLTVKGEPFPVTADDFVVALLETDTGAVIRLTCTFYVEPKVSADEGIEIHGDAGSIRLQSWVAPTAPVRFAPFLGDYEDVEPVAVPESPKINWAIGLRDMVDGFTHGRPHRATGAHAAHIVEILTAITTAAREERTVEVTSGFPRPAPVGWDLP